MAPKSTCEPGASLSQKPVSDGQWHHTQSHTNETWWNFSAAIKLKKRPDEKTLLVRYRECSVNTLKENISFFAPAIACASHASVWTRCKVETAVPFLIIGSNFFPSYLYSACEYTTHLPTKSLNTTALAPPVRTILILPTLMFPLPWRNASGWVWWTSSNPAKLACRKKEKIRLASIGFLSLVNKIKRKFFFFEKWNSSHDKRLCSM